MEISEVALTQEQLLLLKTDILANTNQEVVDGLSNGDAGAIANWYNQLAVPNYHIYRKMVPADEIRDAIDAQNIADITDADRGRAVDLLLIRAERGFSGAVPSDRSAWDDIFSAATGDESQQAINALWTKQGTNAEKVFSLGTGTGATAILADTTSFQGLLTFSDITAALNL